MIFYIKCGNKKDELSKYKKTLKEYNLKTEINYFDGIKFYGYTIELESIEQIMELDQKLHCENIFYCGLNLRNNLLSIIEIDENCNVIWS